MGGTYTILAELPTDATIRFGAVGERRLAAGWYAYVGSALGPGGFARLTRHHDIASGTNNTRHWHIDYLLGHAETSIVDTVKTAGCAAECRIAQAIDGTPIDGIGASDCSCGSHLVFSDDHERLQASVETAHAAHS